MKPHQESKPKPKKSAGTIYVPNVDEFDGSLPAVAIDLSGAHSDVAPNGTGYAQRNRGGVAAMARDVTQTEAADWALAYFTQVRAAGETCANLILEGPLSWAFSSQGNENRLNAVVRSVERRANYADDLCESERDRPWTLNAGASTSLMGQILLKNLAGQIPQGLRVSLFEGFWSWIAKPSRHHAVASGLLAGLAQGNNRIVTLPALAQVRYETTLQFLQIPAVHAERPPLIVFGHQLLADNYHPQA